MWCHSFLPQLWRLHGAEVWAQVFHGLFAVPLFLVDLYLEHTGEEYPLEHRAPLPRIAFAVGALALVAFFSANQAHAFIYFQF